MKCIQDQVTGHVLRLPDEQAARLITDSGWFKYVPKSKWKAQTHE